MWLQLTCCQKFPLVLEPRTFCIQGKQHNHYPKEAKTIFFSLPVCTCVTAGTVQSACTDGQCHCDKETGACNCRENVTGHNCDQCSPNHWNYGQERGCEPCHCDLQHAQGAHCNMVRRHQAITLGSTQSVFKTGLSF